MKRIMAVIFGVGLFNMILTTMLLYPGPHLPNDPSPFQFFVWLSCVEVGLTVCAGFIYFGLFGEW